MAVYCKDCTRKLTIGEYCEIPSCGIDNWRDEEYRAHKKAMGLPYKDIIDKDGQEFIKNRLRTWTKSDHDHIIGVPRQLNGSLDCYFYTSKPSLWRWLKSLFSKRSGNKCKDMMNSRRVKLSIWLIVKDYGIWIARYV